MAYRPNRAEVDRARGVGFRGHERRQLAFPITTFHGSAPHLTGMGAVHFSARAAAGRGTTLAKATSRFTRKGAKRGASNVPLYVPRQNLAPEDQRRMDLARRRGETVFRSQNGQQLILDPAPACIRTECTAWQGYPHPKCVKSKCVEWSG